MTELKNEYRREYRSEHGEILCGGRMGVKEENKHQRDVMRRIWKAANCKDELRYNYTSERGEKEGLVWRGE